MNIVESILDSIDTLVAWVSVGMKQTSESYCDLQTADSETVLVAHDGTLISIIEISGITKLVGKEEFSTVHERLSQTLATTMEDAGHSMQVFFSYNKDDIEVQIRKNFLPSQESMKRLGIQLDDLVEERVKLLGSYCATETVYVVLRTSPLILGEEERKQAMKEKFEAIKDDNLPAFRYTQNVIAAIPQIRDAHDSFVGALHTEMRGLGMVAEVMDVHRACHAIRHSVDPDFTDADWRPILPGDTFSPKLAKHFRGDIADVMWPSLGKQLMPRDAEIQDLRTCRVGDRLYACVYIDLFPKNIQPFAVLFNRLLQNTIPWRISYNVDGDGMTALRFKRMLSSVLAFSSAQNRLINESVNLLDYLKLNGDDAIVRLRVSLATWAPVGEEGLLRKRLAVLSRAVQSWGSCDVSEFCGDAFQGVVSNMLALSNHNPATSTVAPLADVIYMLPLFRPASPWRSGALLFRSPDGKLWPFQPGSPLQTTWIDLVYARPGSGKSVLSNALNLALCLSPGLERLPRVAVIDIGPSSSGLISLLEESLPPQQRHQVAYHRLQMNKAYSINPFDTQLGCRFPMPQERAFLVNFVTLLATPVGSESAYDGVSDMAGLVVDEAYKLMADKGKPNTYHAGVEEMIDAILSEIGFVADAHTTWWEVTDALFMAGFNHEAMLAQRNAMPQLSDLTSVCRSPVVEDLYGKVKIPTGETLIESFNRMISSAVREYPILAGITQFDLGEARVVSLDLDEVAKSGGHAADRQTAVMYMLARYVLARDFYLTPENVKGLPDAYRTHHAGRVSEIREDPKRLIFDEFHRTSKAKAVRDQVVLDMREGRKWNVQIALLSQSLEDFDPVMVEFATGVYIMDAGPEQAVRRASEVFGLSDTARQALRQSVRGPRRGGATFLAQFATKESMNTQLLTLTLGPVELWAFSTTSSDASLRDKLYRRLGARETRRVLAALFPSGSAAQYLSARMEKIKEDTGLIDDHTEKGVIDQLVDDILHAYSENPNVQRLPYH